MNNDVSCGSNKALVELRGVSKIYDMDSSGGAKLEVLHDVSLAIQYGDMVAITGPSGAGKSTLLHILGLLDMPTRGVVLFEGIDVSGMSDDKISRIRNTQIGFVFQFHYLLPEFTAQENVMMPLLIGGNTDLKEAKAVAAQMLESFGLGERINHKATELSGGEQQRVALARAIINNPTVIFADEPTGNLDSKSGEQVFDIMMQIRREYNISFVYVTHDEELAHKADRCISMVDGNIIDEYFRS